MHVADAGNSIFTRIYYRDITCNAIFPSLDYYLWQNCKNSSNKVDGNSQLNSQGIFGLQYSNDGEHCNTINFLNTRLFTTCSDDCMVGLWDIRNLKNHVMMLRGHTGWVKNVEFHRPSGCLLSSSFDRSVRIWDINKPAENDSCESSVLLNLNVLRMRLSPDGESLYLTSIDDFDCAAIHNFIFSDIDESLKVVKQKPLEHYSVSNDVEDDQGACLALFVHPENHAIVVRNDSMVTDSILTSILNMKEIQCGYNSPTTVDIGTVTDYLHIDDNRSLDYIQEISFSFCGRLLASPLGYGIQILSFDRRLNDYTTHVTQYLQSQERYLSFKTFEFSEQKPKLKDCLPCELHEVCCCFGHSSHVLSTAFSPVHYQVATGSINGRIILHEPKL